MYTYALLKTIYYHIIYNTLPHIQVNYGKGYDLIYEIYNVDVSDGGDVVSSDGAVCWWWSI